MATSWLLDADLAAIPIPPLIQRVRSVVAHVTHSVYTTDELYGPIGQRTLLQPALQALRPELRNKALAYACLVNRFNYQREALRDPAAASVLHTRADVCEWLARVAVEAHRASLTDLVDVLTFDFSPRQGAHASSPAQWPATNTAGYGSAGSSAGGDTGRRAVSTQRRRSVAHTPGRTSSIRSSSVGSTTRGPRASATGMAAVAIPATSRDPNQYDTPGDHPAASWNDAASGNHEACNFLYDVSASRAGSQGERQPLNRYRSYVSSGRAMSRSDSDRVSPALGSTVLSPQTAPFYSCDTFTPSNGYGSAGADFYDELREEGICEDDEDEGRASALEVAVLCDAKRLCASPAVQRVMDRVWRGDVVFYANLIDDDTGALNGGAFGGYGLTRARTAVNVRRGRPRGLRDLLRVSRLRVPRYQNLLQVAVYIVFLAVYAEVLMTRSITFTSAEVVLYVLTAGYALDEITQVYKSGVNFYAQYLWNPLDSIVLVNLLLFIGLRTRSYVRSESGWSSLAYGLLACNAVLLWPRLLVVFDRYRWAGRRMAMLRRVFRRATIAAIPIPFVLAGFTHAFYALSNGRATIDEILWTLLRTATGSPEIGFARAPIYHP
ncbi:hypothetical protein THASP1DRAFT_31676, partial [Thamnocephalis sphaerospora]